MHEPVPRCKQMVGVHTRAQMVNRRAEDGALCVHRQSIEKEPFPRISDILKVSSFEHRRCTTTPKEPTSTCTRTPWASAINTEKAGDTAGAADNNATASSVGGRGVLLPGPAKA